MRKNEKCTVMGQFAFTVLFPTHLREKETHFLHVRLAKIRKFVGFSYTPNFHIS